MSAVRVAASAITRVTQLGLVALGCGLAFFSETAGSDLAYLIGWDLLVACYLAVGFMIARHRRTQLDSVRPLERRRPDAHERQDQLRLCHPGQPGRSQQPHLSALLRRNATYGQAIRFFGGMAIIAAWLLVHAATPASTPRAITSRREAKGRRARTFTVAWNSRATRGRRDRLPLLRFLSRHLVRRLRRERHHAAHALARDGAQRAELLLQRRRAGGGDRLPHRQVTASAGVTASPLQ